MTSTTRSLFTTPLYSGIDWTNIFCSQDQWITITYALMMMAMGMMDLKVSQMQWMMVRYTGYASNAGGRTSKGMKFSDFLQFVNVFDALTQWSSFELRSSPDGLCGYVYQCMQQHTCKHLQFHQYLACVDLRNTTAVWCHSLHANLWVAFCCAGQLVSNASSSFGNERFLYYLWLVLTLLWDPSQEYLVDHNVPHRRNRHDMCAAYFSCCPS